MGSSGSRLASLTPLNLREQFSTWEVTLPSTPNVSLGQFGTCHKTISLGSANTRNIRLRFSLEHFERWHGNQKNYGTRGLSLLVGMEGECNDDNDELVLGLKIKKTVNGEDNEDTLDKQVIICGGQKVLIEEPFVVLAFVRRREGDGWTQEKCVYKEDGGIRLTMHFAMKILYAKSVSNDQGEDEDSMGKCVGAVGLINDLNRLYSEDLGLSDIILRSNDGLLLKAHKTILAARSPYFHRCILWNPTTFTEKCPEVELDFRGPPLSALLHWMYTGELKEDVVEFLDEFVELAKKFEMVDLLKIVEKGKFGMGNGKDKGRKMTTSLCLKEKDNKSTVRKLKRAVLAWFPLLRYRFGQRPVGIVASIINAFHGLYELFQ